MPRPLLIVSQSDSLIQIVDINSYSADPDQLASKPTDLELHCLQSQGISRFSRAKVKILWVKAYSVDHVLTPCFIHSIYLWRNKIHLSKYPFYLKLREKYVKIPRKKPQLLSTILPYHQKKEILGIKRQNI